MPDAGVAETTCGAVASIVNGKRATGPRLALGEASTVYTKFPRYKGVAERMARVIPDVRLIYVVRHPIDRIRSHYEHRVASGAETAPMEIAVFDNPIYLDYSKYALQVEQYLQHFPREQLLIVSSERKTLRHSRYAGGHLPDRERPV